MESFPVQLAPELESPGTWRGTREDFHGSVPSYTLSQQTFPGLILETVAVAK